MLDFVAPGTLGDSVRRFVPLRWAMQLPSVRQRLAHGDETSWRVHARGEEGENPRSWLWVCQNAVRMALPAAQRRRRSCSEVSAEPVYRAPLTRSWPGSCRITSCSPIAGVHVRRDFINIGLGRPDMRPFGDWWVNRIGGGRNAKRLQHSTANEQTAAFDEAQQDLENDIETFAGTAASPGGRRAAAQAAAVLASNSR